MQRLIRELRRREVFRTAGLYVGIAWIAIEGASVLLPAFDAPEWILRALIIAAIIGFPITIVLAWIYDVTDEGIEVWPLELFLEQLESGSLWPSRSRARVNPSTICLRLCSIFSS